MLIKNRISRIIDFISDLSSRRDDLVGLGEITINGIKASEGRAVLNEPRLSVAARYSVCSSSMFFVSVATQNLAYDPAVRDLLEEIFALAPMAKPKHIPREEFDAPSGYSGPTKGPFVRKLNKWNLTITRKPNLLDGGWRLHINGIPSVWGHNPEDVADKAKRFEPYLEPAPVFEMAP